MKTENDTQDSNLPRFIQEFPKVAPEILEAWLDSYPEIPPEDYEGIIPEFGYSVSTAALPGDNPSKVFEGYFEVGKYFDIAEAEGAAQTLYFQNRTPLIEFQETSE